MKFIYKKENITLNPFKNKFWAKVEFPMKFVYENENIEKLSCTPRSELESELMRERISLPIQARV